MVYNMYDILYKDFAYKNPTKNERMIKHFKIILMLLKMVQFYCLKEKKHTKSINTKMIKTEHGRLMEDQEVLIKTPIQLFMFYTNFWSWTTNRQLQ